METLLKLTVIMTIFQSICQIVGLICIVYIFIRIIYNIIKSIKNRNSKNKYIQKSIKFELELAEKIKELSEESERSFSKQVKFMLKKYIEMIENK